MGLNFLVLEGWEKAGYIDLARQCLKPPGCWVRHQSLRFHMHSPELEFPRKGLRNPTPCASVLDDTECLVSLVSRYSGISGPFHSTVVNRLRVGQAAVHCGRGQGQPVRGCLRKSQVPAWESPSDQSTRSPHWGHSWPFQVTQNEQTVMLNKISRPKMESLLPTCHISRPKHSLSRPQTNPLWALYLVSLFLVHFLFFSSSFFILYPIRTSCFQPHLAVHSTLGSGDCPLEK